MSISLSRLQAFYGGLEGVPLLRAMIHEEFNGSIALSSSFGADAVLLLAMVAEVEPATPVLFLETGKHFPETLEYVEQVTQTLGLKNVIFAKPDTAMLGRIDPAGTLWQSQPNRCCWLRKVEPLERELTHLGAQALITGRKRYQTVERAEMETIELGEDGRFRINPLAEWDRARMDVESAARNLPQHPLLAQGFRSIGCAPCTRPVQAGQDERAGRWAHTASPGDNGIGEQKTECGIHLPRTQIMDWSV